MSPRERERERERERPVLKQGLGEMGRSYRILKLKENQGCKCLVSGSYIYISKELKKQRRGLERNRTLDHIIGAPDVDHWATKLFVL